MEDIKDKDEMEMAMVGCPMMNCPMMQWGISQCPMMNMMPADSMPMYHHVEKEQGITPQMPVQPPMHQFHNLHYQDQYNEIDCDDWDARDWYVEEDDE